MIMATGSVPVLGRFHINCSRGVTLGLDGKTATTEHYGGVGIAFSKEPMPRGRPFSIILKVLDQQSSSDQSSYTRVRKLVD